MRFHCKYLPHYLPRGLASAVEFLNKAFQGEWANKQTHEKHQFLFFYTFEITQSDASKQQVGCLRRPVD